MSQESGSSSRALSAQQTLDVLYDMSQLLNTQLDREQLATCVAMIEGGVNPEALAAVRRDLRKSASQAVGSGVVKT